MKRRNSIALQASGYTVSGSFATASAVCLLNGKGLSSMFYGALAGITAALTNEMADDELVPATVPVKVKSDAEQSA